MRHADRMDSCTDRKNWKGFEKNNDSGGKECYNVKQ